MEFVFSQEQEDLRQVARSFLADRLPTSKVEQLADSELGWMPESWSEIAKLGWLGVSADEAVGGAELSFVEEAVLLEEFARALYPGPYFATVALALPELPPDLQAPAIAGEVCWSAALDGRLVPDLALVDRVLVAREEGLFAVPAHGEPLETVDATRRLGRLAANLDGTQVGGPEAVARMRVRGRAALAVEAVGVARQALDYSVGYSRAREQFGRPIGSFQAIAHQLADAYLRVELAHSLAYWAAWCIAEQDPQAELAAAAAKSYAAEMAVIVCERAIQVHGGIGFTWEHPLHRYYRRALWIRAYAGTPARQRAEVADVLLAGGGA